LLKRRHASPSFFAGAAQKPHHHGLRLIVPGMRGSNLAQTAIFNHLGKETIALRARQRFKIALAGSGLHPRQIDLF